MTRQVRHAGAGSPLLLHLSSISSVCYRSFKVLFRNHFPFIQGGKVGTPLVLIISRVSTDPYVSPRGACYFIVGQRKKAPRSYVFVQGHRTGEWGTRFQITQLVSDRARTEAEQTWPLTLTSTPNLPEIWATPLQPRESTASLASTQREGPWPNGAHTHRLLTQKPGAWHPGQGSDWQACQTAFVRSVIDHRALFISHVEDMHYFQVQKTYLRTDYVLGHKASLN